MSGDLLLDTTVLIDHLRRRVHLSDLTESPAGPLSAYVSVVSRSEVLAGMRPLDESVTMALLRSFPSLPVSVSIADRAGRWVYQYARQGMRLDLPDALIAATAVEHDVTLVTRNTKHFPMPELRVHTWPDLAAGGPSVTPPRPQPI